MVKHCRTKRFINIKSYEYQLQGECLSLVSGGREKVNLGCESTLFKCAVYRARHSACGSVKETFKI